MEKTIKEWVNEGAMIVDVRTPSEFSEGSIENAVNIPLNEIESRISEFENKPAVIVFCRSGSRSAMARTILSKHQIPNLYNGINEEFMRMQLL
ncbi:rhodanese-like domain-containing protein [Candidatus Kaistella beijingensis]|uniref:rhodanese-like domain-containing protein n=1 Tax=Candidatus Kaistella beijingensis TaxID=2820270 RepID=UPI001CC3E95F|nr:rhodanese-like domain-containing protein [Candidatus Kaistella beijingensis]UBB90382.1 rhodanese-like domain-containing protein [Candidatus Kaistella beijingensis]